MSRRPDQRRNPSQTVGSDPRRACEGQPTWQWFAIPFLIRDETGFDGGGCEPGLRRAGHQRAVTICTQCPLALRCLTASWDTEEFGTYGAVSEVERFYLGGRGRSTSLPRSYERYLKALNRVTKRYGSADHPVVRWITAQGLPAGITAPEVAEPVEPDEVEGAA